MSEEKQVQVEVEQFRAVDEVDGKTVPRAGVLLTKTEAKSIAAHLRRQGHDNVRIQSRAVTYRILNNTGWEDVADE